MTEEVKEQPQPLDPKDLSKARIYDVTWTKSCVTSWNTQTRSLRNAARRFELMGVTEEEQTGISVRGSSAGRRG